MTITSAESREKAASSGCGIALLSGAGWGVFNIVNGLALAMAPFALSARWLLAPLEVPVAEPQPAAAVADPSPGVPVADWPLGVPVAEPRPEAAVAETQPEAPEPGGTRDGAGS